MNYGKTILNILKWVGITLLGIIVLFGAILAVNTDFSSPEDTATLIQKKADKGGITGISIAMIKDNEVVSTYQAGLADVENNRPVTADTTFQIASVSKTVTATAVMQLYERGLLDLDDDINQYLPFQIIHPLYPQSPITFKMLLSHTAGLNDNWEVYDSFYTIDSGGGDSDVSLEAFVQGYFVKDGQWYDPQKNFTTDAPGQEYQYSNSGYALLGYLAERISGESFPEYCKTNIFVPLQMEHTTWLLEDTDISRLAVPYDESDNALPHYSFATYPDGALKTTPEEYAHLLIAMMNDGQYKNKTILQPQTVAEMLTPVAREGKQALAWDYAVLEELMLGKVNDGVIIGHTGGDPGVCTMAVFNPDNKTGLVIFMNKGLELDLKILNLNLLFRRLLVDAGLVN